MRHLQACEVENSEGFGHFPEVNLLSPSNVAFSDNNAPGLSLALTGRMAAEFSQLLISGVWIFTLCKSKWMKPSWKREWIRWTV